MKGSFSSWSFCPPPLDFDLSLCFSTSSTSDCPFYLSGHYWVTCSSLDQSQQGSVVSQVQLRLIKPHSSGLGRGYGTTLYKARVGWQGEKSGFWLGNDASGSRFYLHNIFLLNAIYNNDMKQKNCQIIRRNTAIILPY